MGDVLEESVPSSVPLLVEGQFERGEAEAVHRPAATSLDPTEVRVEADGVALACGDQDDSRALGAPGLLNEAVDENRTETCSLSLGSYRHVVQDGDDVAGVPRFARLFSVTSSDDKLGRIHPSAGPDEEEGQGGVDQQRQRRQ